MENDIGISKLRSSNDFDGNQKSSPGSQNKEIDLDIGIEPTPKYDNELDTEKWTENSKSDHQRTETMVMKS